MKKHIWRSRWHALLTGAMAVLLAFVLIPTAVAAPLPTPATADGAGNPANGAKIFNANCAACHLRGTNVIIANKTLKKAALEKYGITTPAAIVAQITQGKNAMPAFEGRLQPSQIQDVAAYVLQQAEAGW
jgi:cytochrome c6